MLSASQGDKFGRIRNRAERRIPICAAATCDWPGTVAVLATDSEFRKRRFLKTAVSLQDGFRLATMTRDALGKNGPVETVVTEFVARRECPAMWFRIERKRRFEEVLTLFHDGTAAIRTRANDPFELARFTKNVFAVSCSFILALVKTVVAGKDIEMAIELGIKDAGRCRYSLEKFRRDLRHRAAHVRARERLVDARVTLGADPGANVTGICDGTLICRRNGCRVALPARASHKQQSCSDPCATACDRSPPPSPGAIRSLHHRGIGLPVFSSYIPIHNMKRTLAQTAFRGQPCAAAPSRLTSRAGVVHSASLYPEVRNEPDIACGVSR